MVTEFKKKDPHEPITGDDDATVDPDRLAAIRMPTGFLKWVISTPLPKDDKENLWLDTLPPGSSVLKPPPKRKPLPPWAFAAFATFTGTAVATAIAFLLLGYFDSTPQGEPSGSEELQTSATQTPAPTETEATETEATGEPAAPQVAEHESETEAAAPKVDPSSPEPRTAAPVKPLVKPAPTSPVTRPAPKNPAESTQGPKSSPTEETPVRSKPSLFEME